MNTIYFSEFLKTTKSYQSVFEQIIKAFEFHNIDFQLLPNTKDIWARDYMPIQINKNKFVEYVYNPDYLQTTTNNKYITNTSDVCKALGIVTIKMPLVLDGGNVIRHKNKVILTDKIFKENSFQFSKIEVINQIKEFMEVDNVIIIPWDSNEPYGHADGMVRFVDDNTILTHGFYRNYPAEFQEKFYKALEKFNLIELNFNVKNPNEEFNWGYINYLQTNKIILVPVFGIEEDEPALEQLAIIFPEYASREMIIPIGMKSFVKKGGGALNCISWEIEE